MSVLALPPALEVVGWTLATIATCVGLAGLAVKWALMPYLREKLVKPVQETHHSVTVNGGTSKHPTLRDDVSNLADDFRAETERSLRRDERLGEQVAVVREVLDATRDEVHEHGNQSRAAMAIYRKALADQGIHLPVAPGEDGYGATPS